MGRVVYVFLIALVAVLGFLFFKKDTVSPQSPVPDVYGTSKSNISNDWFPKSKTSKNSDVLSVSAKSAILVDYDSGEVIYAKNPTQKLPAASTVKIMTVLMALENTKLSDKFSVAESVAQSEVAFVQKMNQTVQDLGLSDTKFINASGLDEDGKVQYSTAYDLITIARYTWEKYPVFRKIASTYYHLIEPTKAHKAYELYNDTNLLTTYPGVKGIK